MRKATFLEKLRSILDDLNNYDLIRWIDSQRFVVLNPSALAARVLPNYFKHANFDSFVRQLHGYGFHKETSVDGAVHFHHDTFGSSTTPDVADFTRKQSSHKHVIENLQAQVDELKEEINRLRMQNENLQSKLTINQDQKPFETTYLAPPSPTSSVGSDSMNSHEYNQDLFYNQDSSEYIKQEMDMNSMFPASPKMLYPGHLPPNVSSHPMDFPFANDEFHWDDELGYNNSNLYESSNFGYAPNVIVDEFFALGF